jgi:hypothetical protein
MKKMLMLLLFCLPILRGANSLHAQDSLRLTMTSTVSDATCGNKYTVTATTLGTVTQPITFMLDSVWTSTTGLFEKVSWGNHIIYARDAAGRKGFAYFNLQANNAPFGVNPDFKSRNCASTGTLTLYAQVAGSKPVQFKLDNGAFQSDSVFRNVPFGFHSYTVINQAGCDYTGSLKLFPVLISLITLLLMMLFVVKMATLEFMQTIVLPILIPSITLQQMGTA